MGNLAVLPLNVHSETAPGAEALDTARVPGSWKCRQEFDFTGMRLQQHLADPSGVAEVAVYLKRRVSIEEVYVKAPAVLVIHALITDHSQEVADQLVRALAVVQ